jgi:hypothetical protein
VDKGPLSFLLEHEALELGTHALRRSHETPSNFDGGSIRDERKALSGPQRQTGLNGIPGSRRQLRIVRRVPEE